MRGYQAPAIALGVLMFCGAAAGAEFPTSQPYPGITYERETRDHPPQRLFIATVDLNKPGVHLRVVRGGPDPDGRGPWETTLATPTTMARREGLHLIVNGDFFRVRSDPGSTTRPAYRAGIWADVTGPAASRGRAWSRAKEPTPCLVVRSENRAGIESITAPPPDAVAVVAGNTLLVSHGRLVRHNDRVRHPRTAVGLDRSGGRLVILVVDGRRPLLATGMTYDELGEEMRRLGCWEALNLDGGGSSVMAFREPATDGYVIVNTPSDARERPVANALGVLVEHDPPAIKAKTDKRQPILPLIAPRIR